MNDEFGGRREQVAQYINNLLKGDSRPSIREIIADLNQTAGYLARWDLKSVLTSMLADKKCTRFGREYIEFLLKDKELSEALRGEDETPSEVISEIDALLQESGRYRAQGEFQEMIEFMARFGNYAPFNNMLVRIQNPSCSFFATKKNWRYIHKRSIKEDARPMLILRPFGPVTLVYDLDQTDGDELPAELSRFSEFKGDWDPGWMKHLQQNANQLGIRIDFKTLSSTLHGFCTPSNSVPEEKMRIAIHADMCVQSQFGVLCHEMAHILLGHLGNTNISDSSDNSDDPGKWPSRIDLAKAVVEIEAEATAYIVTRHLGLEGTSAAYISRYIGDNAKVPKGVSFDMIARVADRIINMARRIRNSRPARAAG